MSKTAHRLVRIVAYVMSIVLLLYFVPSQGLAVFADGEFNPDVSQSNVSAIENTPEESAAEIVCEDMSLREENIKHFIMSDHTYRAVVYSTPVHYLKDGAWVDIDNSLAAQSALSEEDFSGQITTEGPFSVKFANNINSSKLVRIDKDGYRLSWAYQSSSKRNAVGNVKAKISSDDAVLAAVANASSSISYDYVEENTSLAYEVTPSGVKENIVVHSAADTYVYSFEFKTKGVQLNPCDDGSIEVVANDTDEVVFVIPAPFMTDAKGRYSEAVSYSLSNVKNNKATLIVTADPSWINSDETQFPVVIDPVITTERDRSEIDSAFVASGYAETNCGGSQYSLLSVGRDSAGPGKTRTLIKFDLPELKKGNMVIGSNVAMLMWDSSNGTEADAQITSHVITGNWTATGVTWNNQPSYNSTVLDYGFIPKEDIDKSEATWTYFDVTGAVKEWYEGANNYGVLIKAKNEEAYARCWFNSERYVENEDFTYRYPLIVIDYRNNKGIESYWTYTTVSAGTAGAMSVNDYTGNPVFVASLFTSPSELMPLSMSAVFNGYASNSVYAVGYNHSAKSVVGRGWRLSVQQTLLTSDKFGLSGDSQEHYPYVYTDADGTDHYFVKKTEGSVTTYVDEDGLGLTLTFGETLDMHYYVTDESDNVLIFNAAGNLRRIADADGNRIGVVYQAAGTAEELNNNTDIGLGERIDYVVDGTNHKYTFNYASSNYIQSITDHFGRKMHFVRNSDGVLTKIKYFDETESVFTYEDAAPYSMLTATDDFGYQLKFSYTTAEKGKRVSKIQEYSAPNSSGNRTLGQTISFDRSQYNTTIIRTSGPDDEYNNTDDILTVCQFDNAGRLTSSQAKTAGGTSIGATVAQYTAVPGDAADASAATLKQQNRVLNSASFGKNTTNWITNANFESDLSGWTDSEPDANATFSVSTDHAYFGKQSAKISVSAVTAQTGRATLLQDISGLAPGSTYTYSVYVKTENLEQVYNGTYNGAFIRLLTQDSDESVSVYSECITEPTDEAFDNGWKRLTATITLPEDCTKVRAYIQLRNMTGTMYADGAQLEKGEFAHPVNLLENAGFEKGSSGLPTSWTVSGFDYSATSAGTVVEGVTTAHQKDGGHSVRLVGDANTDKYLSQTIPVSGNPLETYIVSGWASGRAISSNNHKTTSSKDAVLFELSISVKYKNSDGTYRSESRPAAKFNNTVSSWQYTAQTFSLASTSAVESEKDDIPVSITIKVRYKNQGNSVYFDHLQLLRDNANTYTYDEDGNMVSVSGNAEQQSKMEYDGPDLLSVSDNLGYKYEYMYDNYHNVSLGQSAGDVFTIYDRSFETGQIRGVSVESYDATLEILETLSYTGSIGNIQPGAHVATTTDQHGRITTYSYDDYGRNSSITTPDGISTKYTYKSTSSNQISKIQAVDTENNDSVLGSVSYTYDGNRLKALSYGQDTYTFNVDRFGNATSTTINGKTLSTNTYATNNGKLKSVTYANGNVRTYSYNWLGQISSVGNGSHTMYRYTYDLNGTLTKFTDNFAERETTYIQESLNRPVRERYETKSGTFLGMVEYGYDQRNHVDSLAVTWGGHTHVAEYLYEAISGRPETQRYEADNLPTRYTYVAGRRADYSYDDVNRLTARVFSTKAPLTNTYTYYSSSGRNVDGFTCYQTNQLHTETINGVTYEYIYDLSGNITHIRKGSGNNLVSYRRYYYDALSRLTDEVFCNAAGTPIKTVSYTYDECGNILSRREAYPSGASSITSYAYGSDADAGWSKLLTSYDGQSIDYDAIGNPISYRGATLTWGNGRQLKRYEGGGNTITYTYDDTGLRTSKTVNGAKSEYLYVDGQLLGEVRDGHHIHYSYDSFGNLSVIKYYTSDTAYYVYYVVTNAQGDVVSLHNSDGTMKVSYEYDAWGNVVNMTDTTGAGIGTINPFRYRGYYYDTETGLYYLNSRYYDPEIRRFISTDNDAPVGQNVTGNNMFAYCVCNTMLSRAAELLGRQPASSARSGNTLPTNELVVPGLSIYYDVPVYAQGDTNLCWAFCQVMTEDFRAGIASTNDQARNKAIAIAKSKYGEDWDQGGFPTHCFYKNGNIVTATDINSLVDLYKALVRNGPIYGYYWDGVHGEEAYAHLVVITGVDWTKGLVYTNNSQGFGIRGEQTYAQFLACDTTNSPYSGRPLWHYMYINW